MDIKKLKQQFPFIEVKSENWYYNTLTKKWIHKDKISSVLAYYAVKNIDEDKKKFKQIDSHKSFIRYIKVSGEQFADKLEQIWAERVWTS